MIDNKRVLWPMQFVVLNPYCPMCSRNIHVNVWPCCPLAGGLQVSRELTISHSGPSNHVHLTADSNHTRQGIKFSRILCNAAVYYCATWLAAEATQHDCRVH